MKFKCTRCGTCCTKFTILLTDSDLKRLKEGWWNDSEFAKLYCAFGVLEGIPEATGFVPAGFERYPVVELEGGIKGWLILKRKLDENGSGKTICFWLEGLLNEKLTFCRTYEIRPMMCRLYPYSWLDEAGSTIFIRDERKEECEGFQEKESEIAQAAYENVFTMLYGELVQYRQKVDEWNAKDKKGNLQQFLRYLLGEDYENYSEEASDVE